MANEVLMPQMGESIAEGTIVRWIKKVGDTVDRDEPLFEISTDKVDAEIPSPTAGVVLEIHVKEGETVPVNSVVALIGQAGEKGKGSKPSEESEQSKQSKQSEESKRSEESEGSKRSEPRKPEPVAPVTAAAPRTPVSSAAPAAPASLASGSVEDLRRTKSSPVVRKIAAEHGIDITRLEGTGISGRVTKKDILSHVESPAFSAGPADAAKPAARTAPAASVLAFKPGENVRLEKMSVMRKKIA